MLTGWTQKVLGATSSIVHAYRQMCQTPEWQTALPWSAPDFTLADYDIVFLPGGHDRGIRQILDSPRVHRLLADYFPLTKKPSIKLCGAICHGVQVLAHSKDREGNSILAQVATTSLPGLFEDTVYWGTRTFLGDYYKTYGASTPNVETVILKCLKDPNRQWRSSVNPATPLVVEDERYNYLSGRWPGDAQLLAEKIVELYNASD